MGEKKLRVDALQKSIDAARVPAGEKSPPGVTKLEIAEVRHLTRIPPEHIRRTLIAVWLVLNCERYRGKTSIQVDETRVWQLCQKMLGDNNFTSRLQQFDPTILDGIPYLTLYIARTYLGFQGPDGKTSSDESRLSAPDARPCTSESAIRRLCSRRSASSSSLTPISPQKRLREDQGGLSRCSTPLLASQRSASMSMLALGASPQKVSTSPSTDSWSALRAPTPLHTPSSHKQGSVRADPWAAVHAGSRVDTVRRIGLSPSRPASRLSSKNVVLAPLDVEDVHYANGSCGALFQWLRELVLDRAKHVSLLQEIHSAKEDLAAAEKAHGLAEQRVQDLQDELRANRMEQSYQERFIARLQQDLPPQSTPTGTNAGKTDIKRWHRRSKWLRPAYDWSNTLTVTMQGLQNTTWWRTCERYKMVSPSQAESSSRIGSGQRGFALY